MQSRRGKSETRANDRMDGRINQRSLAEHIVEDLEAKIVGGNLKPGQRIVVETLCKTLAVSPTPLREAFQIMEGRGFVIREPRKGVSVARITGREAQDIYKIRASIEGLAMSLAVQCRPPGLIDELKKLHEKMIRAAEKGNDAAYQRLNRKFHERIVDSCDNSRLIQLIRDFDKQTTRYRVALMVEPGWMENSTRIHGAIIAAFDAGDAEAAEAIRRGVVLGQIKRFSKIFNNGEEP
ncbi:MAG: GntR family transcriptional regulator [Syntrophales bacterium]|nr:GntR family transcriptional regulator [Syntrophales bacterium]